MVGIVEVGSRPKSPYGTWLTDGKSDVSVHYNGQHFAIGRNPNLSRAGELSPALIFAEKVLVQYREGNQILQKEIDPAIVKHAIEVMLNSLVDAVKD